MHEQVNCRLKCEYPQSETRWWFAACEKRLSGKALAKLIKCQIFSCLINLKKGSACAAWNVKLLATM